jgi:hypothetical protein
MHAVNVNALIISRSLVVLVKHLSILCCAAYTWGSLLYMLLHMLVCEEAGMKVGVEALAM